MNKPKENETKPINRLILIGNGFDLAHGMKTSYGDFILWYFQKYWEEAKHTHIPNPKKPDEIIFSTELINFHFDRLLYFNMPQGIPKINSLYEVIALIREDGKLQNQSILKITFNSYFFKTILSDLSNKNWVDIENIYYNELRRHYLNYSLRDSAPISLLESTVKELNDQFDVIKRELSNYLHTITIPSENELSLQFMYELPFQPDSTKDEPFELNDVLFLNFNYTSTTQKYKGKNASVIHIHGELNSPANPIIFGYGDERDETYELLEKANIPEVFTHIKSFDYFKTNNYSRLLAFLESEYDVYIMGHSCGLSDRTLLSSIFENPNCRYIKLFYYATMDNYRKTTYEISRHFTDKAEMRKKVLDFTKCNPMPQSS